MQYHLRAQNSRCHNTNTGTGRVKNWNVFTEFIQVTDMDSENQIGAIGAENDPKNARE